MAKNHMKADPTRTTLIRRAFEAEIKRRISKLKAKVRHALIEEDVFGFKIGKISKLKLNQRFAFETDPQKVKLSKSGLRSRSMRVSLKSQEALIR